MDDPGIYIIHNMVDDRPHIYVGKSVNLANRWQQHRNALRAGRHDNDYLQKAWIKYKEASFEYKVVERRSGPLLNIEKVYADYYKAVGYTLYNLRAFGEGTEGHSAETRRKIGASQKGRVFTAEHLARLSMASKGKAHTDESKVKMSAAHKGKVRTAEHRAKIGAANKIRVHTDESRSRMSAAQKGKGISAEARARMSANKGKVFTDESRARMSEAGRGRVFTAEHRAKISAAGIGRTHTAEARARMSATRKGRAHTAEVRARMSAAWNDQVSPPNKGLDQIATVREDLYD